MTSTALRRLPLIETFLLVVFLGLYYFFAGTKDVYFAAGFLSALGLAALAFVRPKWGIVIILFLAFVESVQDNINALADTAQENDLTGMPYILNTRWFSWGALMIFSVLLLSYFCSTYLKKRQPVALNALEWIILLPAIVALGYLPVSLINGNLFQDYLTDLLSPLILAGTVVLARILGDSDDIRKTRYFLLDWFIALNMLVLVPLWAYNLAFDPWRSGAVGIAAIRSGVGSYDFNFLLVPILGMVLTYDDHLGRSRRRFYQFAFFLSLLRIVISLFRGVIGGTLIAIVLASFMVDASRRWKWVRSLLIFTGAAVLILALLIATVPAARATFNVALVRRLQEAVNQGTGAGSLEFRQLEIGAAMDDIRREPVFGYGPGSLVNKNFDPEQFSRRELYLHSAYVWYWYKMGVPGLGVLAVFFIGVCSACFGLLRKKLDPSDRAWVIGAVSAILAMLPIIHTNNMMVRNPGAYSLSMALVGVILIYTKYRKPAEERPVSDGGGKA